jgi:cytochrome oxidase assembly protein ShyY1
VAYRGLVRRLGVFLKPGWIALALVVIGFAYVCFTQLAPWQLGKNTATEARNALITNSFSTDPVALTDLVSPGQTPAADQEWRVVTVTGSYLPQEQVLARLRTVNGTAAYEVLTPFRLRGGETVLVDRGYVRPVVGTDAPPVDPAPAGEVTLQARLRLDEAVDPTRATQDVGGETQVYSVNAAVVGAVAGTTISPGYLQLGDGAPGVLGVLPLPQTDSGPYLSYGLQWLAFGIMAPLALAYFVRAEIKERRRDEEDADPTAAPPERTLVGAATGGRARSKERNAALRDALAGEAPPAEAVSAPTEPAESSVQARMSDRYGKRR